MHHTPEENKILQKEDLSFSSEIIKAFPTQFYLAVSVVCDIRCPYCPRQYYIEDVKERAGLMDFDNFLKVAPYLKYADYAGFFGLGEPFLNKRFFDFIGEAKKFGAYAATSTHGVSLTPDTCNKLLEVGIDEIAVSIDSPKRKTFEYLRMGADFHAVRKNVLYLNKLKQERNLKKPYIHIAAAISRFNVKQMTDMVYLAKELGAVRIVFTDLIIVNKENHNISVAGHPIFLNKLEKSKKIGKKIGIEVLYFPQNPFPYQKQQKRDFKGDEKFGCYEAWRTLVIERNGVVRPCCYLEEEFGNVFETPIEDIINNDAFKHLRNSFITRNLHPTCQSCANLQIIK